MHCLDFLSEPPNIFIFKQKRNKTNFGGVLFLLYIIIMGLISFVYILDYSINDKYIYEGMIFNNKTDNVDEIGKIIDDNEITPYVNLTFNIIYIYQNLVFMIKGIKNL